MVFVQYVWTIQSASVTCLFVCLADGALVCIIEIRTEIDSAVPISADCVYMKID